MAGEFTKQEKIEVVEHFITQWRPARSSSIEGERDTYLILKAIAADLRADAPGRASDTALKIEKEIANAERRKTPSGYEPGSLRAVAELVIGRWKTIRAALEHFEQRGNS